MINPLYFAVYGVLASLVTLAFGIDFLLHTEYANSACVFAQGLGMVLEKCSRCGDLSDLQ